MKQGGIVPKEQPQMKASDFITDKEAAELFGPAIQTLRHHCMKSFVCPKGKVDVRNALPVVVGRRRLWNRQRIIDLLNTPTEIGRN